MSVQLQTTASRDNLWRQALQYQVETSYFWNIVEIVQSVSCQNRGTLLADHHTSKYAGIGGDEAYNHTICWSYENHSAGIFWLVLWEVFCWYCAGIMSVPMPAALRPDRGHLALTAHSPQPSVQCVTCRMHGVQHSTTLNITCSALQKQSRCPAPKKNYLILLLFSSPAYAGSCSSCGMSWAAMLGLELQTIHRFSIIHGEGLYFVLGPSLGWKRLHI